MEKAESLSFPMVIGSGGSGQSLHNEILIGAKPFKLSLPYFSPTFCSDQSPTITFYYKLHHPWALRRNQYPRTANFD
jgi:hypothetical protein